MERERERKRGQGEIKRGKMWKESTENDGNQKRGQLRSEEA